MALFSSSKPTEKVEFVGGWVELKLLSKGAKNQYQVMMSSLLKDLGQVNTEKLKNAKEEEIPENIDLEVLLNKTNQANYFLLSKAIKSWSEKDVDINEESVQDLDEETFDLLMEKVQQMNKLSAGDEKN
jgi:hypothetical protein